MEQYINNLSDITYQSELIPPFLKCLAHALRKGGIKFALITYSHLRVCKLCAHLKWQK